MFFFFKFLGHLKKIPGLSSKFSQNSVREGAFFFFFFFLGLMLLRTAELVRE